MKIIKPSYEIMSPVGIQMLADIEKIGRICYKSEDRITEYSCLDFVRKLVSLNHGAMIEHGGIISVKFICDRGVSHELVRHRLASFAQESTRYCSYNKDKFNNELTFVLPSWMSVNCLGQYISDSEIREKLMDYTEHSFLYFLLNAERAYMDLIRSGWKPEQARAVLPNAVKTEIVVTANLRQWQHIFELRTSKKAHPQMRELMCPLLDELKSRLPVIFDSIDYEI